MAQVISHEGTEGTISHQRNASLIVSSASLSVSKTVQTVSDPVNGTSVPYNLPGATLRYTIRVINSGAGNADTDTVVMTDPVPENTQLCVATVSNCVAPAFSDGTTTSGLAAAAFEYSFVTGATACDNASFIGTSPTADGNGYDANVTCIRQRPTGSMNGSSAFYDIQMTVAIQ